MRSVGGWLFLKQEIFRNKPIAGWKAPSHYLSPNISHEIRRLAYLCGSVERQKQGCAWTKNVIEGFLSISPSVVCYLSFLLPSVLSRVICRQQDSGTGPLVKYLLLFQSVLCPYSWGPWYHPKELPNNLVEIQPINKWPSNCNEILLLKISLHGKFKSKMKMFWWI